jgi:hypothetical protein
VRMMILIIAAVLLYMGLTKPIAKINNTVPA